MTHPCVIKPDEHAVYAADRMGKTTIFESPSLLVGLNAFEPGQEHGLHAHAGQDKAYLVTRGSGVFLLGRPRTADVGRRSPGRAGGDSARCPEYR